MRAKLSPISRKYCAEASDPQPSAFYILGVSEYRRGDYDAAIKLLQQSIGTHSAMEQSAYLFLGQAYLKRGDNNSALMAFENAYRVDYDREVRETAFYNYAVARMDGGRVPFGNSVALLENFLQEYPNSTYSADVQRYIVNGYMSDNDYESALAALDKIQNPSAELIQAKQRVLLVLGSREYTSGKISQSISHLTQARRYGLRQSLHTAPMRPLAGRLLLHTRQLRRSCLKLPLIHSIGTEIRHPQPCHSLLRSGLHPLLSGALLRRADRLPRRRDSDAVSTCRHLALASRRLL